MSEPAPTSSGITPESDSENLSGTVVELARTLLQDLRDLRAGKITNRDAQTRALIGREVLRAVNLQFQGMRLISDQARLLGSSKANGKQIDGEASS